MKASTELKKLVDRFEQNLEAYKSGQYKEAQVRREFVDPFFEHLGWDVQNKQGYAEAYKDVIHEDSIKIGGLTKAPDYCFRIGGARKFFLEAKKPSVDIKDDIGPAYQLRRYAWSAKLPLSLLTDFEEFAVYDCRVKPDKADKASKARTMYFTYDQYVDNWDEISSIFSREAVLKGSFDKYADETKRKRGTAEVDKAFLLEIELWRKTLANNIALRNPDLTQRELNLAVQKTIDRIIFLRICEDRGIETYGQMMSLLSGPNVYGRMTEYFRRADQRYNSGLFHFRPEKGRPGSPDEITPGLKIDDKHLKEIIKKLYYPDSPYEFSVLPADILGQVYEQFLGKVIRLTPRHRAVVEDKPEVKKAGGVYYTPTYIVDYIVKNTVGKLLEGKTPAKVSKLRILDPACGSGSFLIGAYQSLLDWHREYYENHDPRKLARKRLPPVYQGDGGDWHLTTTEKKRILLNNIYGVDIDLQAVEVTKLSLLLKVLEGENKDTLQSQLALFRERALPDLGNNIKCGNSLIGPDFYEGKQMDLMDEEERYRINVFDWDTEFAEIMNVGGFDAVIGNPPYIRIQALKEWAPIEVEFYKERFKAASKGNYDIYVVFVEKGLDLLNKNGQLGFILPHKFFNAKYGESLRSLISMGNHLSDVVHFGHQQVFDGATTYTCLLFLGGKKRKKLIFKKVDDLLDWRMSGVANSGKIPLTNVSAKEWNFIAGKGYGLFERLSEFPVKLEDVTSRIFQGIKTSADKIYIVNEIEQKDNKVLIYSNEKESEYWLEPDLLHPLIKGGDSRRYSMSRTDRVILFPYMSNHIDKMVLIISDVFQSRYPLTWHYLLENKQFLEGREKGKMRGSDWYAYGRTQALDVMALPKIFTPDIAPTASFSLDANGEAFFTGGVAGGYGILVHEEFSREYILGLVNSRLLDWFNRQIATQMRGGWYSYEARFIKNLPIIIPPTNNTDARSSHDKIIKFVEQMLALNKQLPTIKTGHERVNLQRQIDATDRQIDNLVYELYRLTDEEIEIVEENSI